MMFMNESEIDHAAFVYRNHPVLGPATRFLSAYRDEVNRKSDGWPYWGSKTAAKLMQLIYDAHPLVTQRHDPTEAEIRKAIGPIKAFCTKRGLTCPLFECEAKQERVPMIKVDRNGQCLLPGFTEEMAA